MICSSHEDAYMWNPTKGDCECKSCECKWGLNKSVCDSMQNWNHDECGCWYRELDDYIFCKDDYIWNTTTSDFECNKACEIDKYLVIKNC